MTKNLTSLRLAPLALAAALAFPTTTLAQQTVTSEPAPVAAPPPVQTPAIVVPTFPEPSAAASASAAPVVAASPARAAAAHPAPVRAAVPTARAPTRASAAPEVVPAVAAPIAAAPADQTLPAAAPIAPVSVTPATVPTRNDPDNSLALAGLAGIIALGGAGLLWTRRRDRSLIGERRVIVEPIAAAPPPVAVTPPLAEPLPPAAPAVAPAAAAGTLAAGPLPNTPERRRDLIEAMVAAPPDEANPFRTRKARRHRARLILQGMAADQAGHTPVERNSYDWNKLNPEAERQREFEDA